MKSSVGYPPADHTNTRCLFEAMKIHNGGRRPRPPVKPARPCGAVWALAGQREYCRGVLERWLAAEQAEAAAHPEPPPQRDEA